ELSDFALGTKIENCTFNNDTFIVGSTTNHAFIYSDTLSSASFTQIHNNTFVGGHFAIWIKGAKTNIPDENIEIIGNSFVNQTSAAIKIHHQKSLKLNNNEVKSNVHVGNVFTHGFIIGNSNFGMEIINNSIVTESNFPNNGVFIMNSSGTSLNKALIYNNRISVGDTLATDTLYALK